MSSKLSAGFTNAGIWLLCGILLFALITRVYNLGYPSRYYFDEVYHAMTVKLVARNDPRAYEWTHGTSIEPDTYVEWLHPPLAKYFQALGVKIYGENGFGWRISSVIFGVLTIGLTAALAHALFRREWVTLAAAGLASLDGLLFAQSRIAMNDIHVTAFFLITLLGYVWYRRRPGLRRLALVGVLAGLTMATKWSGAFSLAIVLMFEAGSLMAAWFTDWRRDHSPAEIGLSMYSQTLIRVVLLGAVPLLVYIASYAQMFAQGKDFGYFLEMHRQIFAYQLHLDATHPYQSQPWQWVLNLRPVWLFVEYGDGWRADIYNMGNPLIFWGGIVAALVSLSVASRRIWNGVRYSAGRGFSSLLHSRQHPFVKIGSLQWSQQPVLSALFLAISYLMVWVPWQFSPRIMFFYHYAPAVPLLCIMIAFRLHQTLDSPLSYRKETAIKIHERRLFVYSYLGLTILFAVVWFPHWAALPVPQAIKDNFYLLLPMWK